MPNMDANRCPDCENDITESMNSAIIACVNAGSAGVASVTCPHCGEELNVAVAVSAAVMRKEAAVAN
jgi:primosomal protein N'